MKRAYTVYYDDKLGVASVRLVVSKAFATEEALVQGYVLTAIIGQHLEDLNMLTALVSTRLLETLRCEGPPS